MIICIAAKIKKALGDMVEKRLAGHDLRWLETMAPEERIASLKEADIVLCAMLTVELKPEEKLLLGRAKHVQTMSAGVNQIDFSQLPREIALHCNAGGWSHAMAEHALAMTLACTRALRYQTEDLRDGKYSVELRPMRLLDGSTVLIFGWGGIGKASAKLYKAFGSKLIAVSRNAPKDEMLEAGYSFGEFKEALPQADVVLLCCPSNVVTRNMINAETLALMKEDAILVNVARADLIVKEDLEKHLHSHPQFYAALDVWWKERRAYPTDGEEILKLPNVIGTPHNSHLSSTAYAEAADSALKNIERFINGEPRLGVINLDEYR